MVITLTNIIATQVCIIFEVGCMQKQTSTLKWLHWMSAWEIYDCNSLSVYLASYIIQGGVGGIFLHVAFYDGRSVQRHIALPTM